MTVVAIWLEPTEDLLWSVADTRISAPGQSGGTTIRTDSGAKLFAIPLQCYHSGRTLSTRRMLHYSSSIGYAFAGDVLPATMTFAIAGTFLQNLITPQGVSIAPPSLGEISNLIRSLAERFSKEALGSSNGNNGRFTAAVFGWCPVLNRFAIYELTPQLNPSGFMMQCIEHLPTDNLFLTSFGSGAMRLTEKIASIRRDGDKYHRTARIRKLAAEALVEENVGDVGGSLSIGLASQSGFQLYSYVTPIVKGFPEAKISFNGIDLNELGQWIGHYIIAIDGMT
jgi:hypothetical protein